LKRAHLRRVKSIESSPSQVESSVSPYEGSNGVTRKKRTSAAMIGLALSMGASSLLIPRQSEEAKAAEPTPTDAATVSLVPSASSAPAASMVEHTVTKGQTLWKLAQQYQVSVDAIAAANSLKATDVIKVGQVVRIPTAAPEAQSAATKAPQLVASADLDRLPATAQSAVDTTERDASLDRLRQQQEKLRQSLAGLRTKDQATKVSEATQPEATSEQRLIAAKPPQAAALQARSGDATTVSSEDSTQIADSRPTQDWLRTNQALTAPETAAPRMFSQVPSPVAATPAARPSTVRPPVQQIASSTTTEMVSYQVGVGDTVAIIARAHNISPSTLVQANRISDPNFIFVGQILRVPAAQSASASTPAPRARQTAAQPAATRLSVVPTTVSPTTQPNWGGSAPSTSGRDPHIENLLSEIKVMRERHRAAAAPATPINVPAPEAVRTPSSLPTLSVGTQFNPGGLNAVEAPQARSARSQSQAAVPIRVPAAESRPASIRQPQQVAAAPAGSESYAPLLQPVTGRTVSPDLPPLQGEENFLPEGAPSFNGYIWPAKGLLTSGYGWRWGRMHAGIDIAADVGTPIVAAADGVIEFSGWNSGGYGILVEIRHADGSLTRYAHNNTTLVKEGQKVKQGEQIAEMGSTGYSTGPHLHFEVHSASDGGSVDPISYLPQE
jgi:murein DD-endopeptidase MepM/ murein hydrolase activator NlpD